MVFLLKVYCGHEQGTQKESKKLHSWFDKNPVEKRVFLLKVYCGHIQGTMLLELFKSVSVFFENSTQVTHWKRKVHAT